MRLFFQLIAWALVLYANIGYVLKDFSNTGPLSAGMMLGVFICDLLWNKLREN